MNTSIAESWTSTNTGNFIDLLDPDPKSITIEDIAGALSKICRFNGQLKKFYSVAQHSMYVASLVPEPFKLQALLHDAAEAYVCDIPSPLKRLLGTAYRVTEYKVAKAIGQKFDVNLTELHPVVKQADAIMLVSERDALQDKPQSWGTEIDEGVRYPNFNPQQAEPVIIERMFLRRFEEYKLLHQKHLVAKYTETQ